jgi:hypothetical protein
MWKYSTVGTVKQKVHCNAGAALFTTREILKNDNFIITSADLFVKTYCLSTVCNSSLSSQKLLDNYSFALGA